MEFRAGVEQAKRDLLRYGGEQTVKFYIFYVKNDTPRCFHYEISNEQNAEIPWWDEKAKMEINVVTNCSVQYCKLKDLTEAMFTLVRSCIPSSIQSKEKYEDIFDEEYCNEYKTERFRNGYRQRCKWATETNGIEVKLSDCAIQDAECYGYDYDIKAIMTSNDGEEKCVDWILQMPLFERKLQSDEYIQEMTLQELITYLLEQEKGIKHTPKKSNCKIIQGKW